MRSSSMSATSDKSSSSSSASSPQVGSAQPRPTQLPPPSSSQDDSNDSGSQPSSGMSFLRNRKARNAHSKSITTAEGLDTYGALNRHPAAYSDFSVGVQDAQGARMTMEDAYSFVVDFGGVRGQGFFAIFDGHAGPEAAEWCGNHFHERFLSDLKENPEMPIPDVMSRTFLAVDRDLSNLSEDKGLSSGCTAVTAFLRIEDSQGGQSFLQNGDSSMSSLPDDSSDTRVGDSSQEPFQKDRKATASKSGFRNAVRSLATSVTRSRPSSPAPPSTPRSSSPTSHPSPNPIFETANLGLRRVLYTGNAGDARAVLSRAGKAVRLTYDHKGADKQEAKRIQDAGGFVLNNRVNGVLAVTRSLGDSSMKEFVVGSPYTTETPLASNDEFLILACDGLWDVASDQKAVDLVRDVQDCDEAAKILMEFALNEGTRDNVTVVVVRFSKGGK